MSGSVRAGYGWRRSIHGARGWPAADGNTVGTPPSGWAIVAIQSATASTPQAGAPAVSHTHATTGANPAGGRYSR